MNQTTYVFVITEDLGVIIHITMTFKYSLIVNIIASVFIDLLYLLFQFNSQLLLQNIIFFIRNR